MKIKKVMYALVFLGYGFLRCSTEVFFAPDDRPTSKLISLIEQAHTKIYAAVFMITDKTIAEKLIEARKRGVDVQVIVDRSSWEGGYGKGMLLKDGKVDMFVFGRNHQHSFHQPLMHNKFAIIDKKLWTGSFNWTKSANEKNQENVIVTDAADICARFEHHFNVLKKRCTHYAPEPKSEEPLVPEGQSWWERWWNTMTTSISSFFTFVKNDIRKTLERA
jgi:phosphatidylserine/phosphatidylglycerophosphate/cardiolipin synthase-like enzyme